MKCFKLKTKMYVKHISLCVSGNVYVDTTSHYNLSQSKKIINKEYVKKP